MPPLLFRKDDNMAAKATEKIIAEQNTPVNPMEEMVEVYLPKVPGEASEKYVGINGRGWQIPRGKKTKVPLAVAEILYTAQEAEDAAERFSDEEQKKMAVIQGLP